MWFEILPSCGIIVAALGLPGVAIYHIHKGLLGNPYRRSMVTRWERWNYQRDDRLTGDPYKISDLDAIPDE